MKGGSGEKGSRLAQEEEASQSSSESSSEWEESERGGGGSEEEGEEGGSVKELAAIAVAGVGVQSWLRKAAALWQSLRLYAQSDWLTDLMGGGRYLELEVKMLGELFIERF